MTELEKAARQALEALEQWNTPLYKRGNVITALRRALEQQQSAQQQEPVMCPFPCGWKRLFGIIIADGAFLARSLEEDEAITTHQREVVMRLIDYAKTMALHGMNTYLPASKPWVWLTDEEIKRMAAPWFLSMYWPICNTFAKEIEAKLREKNGGTND